MTSMIMKEIGADFNTENSMEIVILIINEKSKNIVYKMTKDYKINPPPENTTIHIHNKILKYKLYFSLRSGHYQLRCFYYANNCKKIMEQLVDEGWYLQ